MSGVAGGNRIEKADVKKTFDSYVEQVLSKVPGFKKATLSGSVKLGTKPDYGDLDLVIWFEGTDKKEVKQRIIDLITKLPSNIIVPFKSEKHAGRKYYNAGELISVLFPIVGKEDQFIQVDNIIALTEEEHQFKNNFLDLPAEKQGLIIGLAKTVLLEKNPQEIFNRLGIRNLPKLEADEEFEFNLSSVKLTLRKVKLDNFKEIGRQEIWSTTNWNQIGELFKGFNIDGTFEELLDDLVNNLKNERSRNRIKGVFKGMVSVKSGEVGTPKGFAKEKALKQVDTLLEEEKKDTVALYGGGFKPPHKAHFKNAEILASKADKLIIFIGPKVREGLEITAQQAKKIWEIYSRYIPVPVEIIISKVTPIRDIYEWAEENYTTVDKIITGTTKEDSARFKAFTANKEKYPNTEILELPVVPDSEESKLSATNIRQSQEYLESGEWLPTQIDGSDVKKIVQILLPVFEQKESNLITKVLEEFYSATEYLIEPQEELEEEIHQEEQIPTEAPQPTANLDLPILKARIENQIGKDYYDVKIEGEGIKVTPKGTNTSFDYTPFLASVLEYAITEQGYNYSIPEIKIQEDLTEGDNFFGRTAYYSPDSKEIVLYVAKRHPKDVVRSFCHELIHHIQNEEGRLGIIQTTNTTKDNNLIELEKEAYLRGNMLFRTWEDTVKND